MACLNIVAPFLIAPAHAAIPRTVSYQSRLLDASSAAVTSTTAIQFSLYNHPTAGAFSDAASEPGALVWKETYDQGAGACASVTPDAKGYFFVRLGSCNAFPAYLTFDEPLYLGVKIGSDPEATPRVPFAAHPYALNSDRVNNLQATTTAQANQLLALDSNLNFDIATGTFSGAGLSINGTSTLQTLTFTMATGSSLNLTTALSVGGIRLDAAGSNNVTSGASLVGVFDEFDNSNATTVQAALRDFDVAITAVSSSVYAMTLQKVTDNGNTTTNAIVFAGGTSTASLHLAGRDTVGMNDGRATELLNVLGGATASAILKLDADDGAGAGNRAGIIINSDYANGGDGVIVFSNNGTQDAYISSDPSTLNIVAQNAGDGVTITTSNAHQFRFEGSGNFGIGNVTADLFKLQVSGHTGPSVHNAYDLGSATTSWRNLWAAGFVSTSQLYVNGLEVYGGTTTLDMAYDGGGSGLGRFITADAGPITITGLRYPQGAIDVINTTNSHAVYVNNTGEGVGFSARNMNTGSGFYARNQGSGSGIRVDNGTTNGLGMRVDNPNFGTGISLDNSGDGLGQLISNSGNGIGLTIENSASLNGLGMYIRQNMGRAMVVDNNTLNDGITINNNDTGNGLYILNQSTKPGINIYDIGGKTGLMIDKPLNGGNAIELSVADGARSFYVMQSGTGEGFWMRNTGTGPSLWIEDEGSDTTPFVLTAVGNLGLGTSTPSYGLDVVGDARLSRQLMLGRYSGLPATGLQSGAVVYENGTQAINYWNGTSWKALATTDDVSGLSFTLQDAADNSIATDGYVLYDTGAATIEDDGGMMNIMAEDGGYEVGLVEAGGSRLFFKSSSGPMNPAEIRFNDGRGVGERRGIEYGGDYSSDFSLRSLVDKGFVVNYVASTTGGLDLQQVTDNGNVSTNPIQFAGGTSTGQLIVNTKLGIGTNNPTRALEVLSDSPIQTVWRNTAGEGVMIVNDNLGDEIGLSDIRTDGYIAAVSKADPSLYYYARGVLNADFDTYRVGINTATPESLLHIQGGVFGDAILTVNSDDGAHDGRDAGIVINSDNGNGSDAAYIKFNNNGTPGGKLYSGLYEAGFNVEGDKSFLFRTNNQDRLNIGGDGRIGISTTTPEAIVSIDGSVIGGNRMLEVSNQDDRKGVGLGIDAYGGDLGLYYERGNHLLVSTYFGGAGNSYDHVFLGDRRLTVRQASGFVGIGTESPANTLHVMGAVSIASSTPATSSHALYNLGGVLYWNGIPISTASSLVDTDGDTRVMVEKIADEDHIRFDTAGTERMYINSVGRIGVGTTAPLVSLFTVGPNSHESSSFSVSGIAGMTNIANFRDKNGENVFRASGSVADNDLIVGFGDIDYGGNGTSVRIDYANDSINISNSELRFYENASTGNFVGFIAPSALSSDTIWTLPARDGSNNQVLVTDGSGALSWATSSDLVYNIYNSDGSIPTTRNVTIDDGNELRFLDQANPANYLYLQTDYNSNGNLKIGGVNNDEGSTNSYVEFKDNLNLFAANGMELNASTNQIDLYGNNAVLTIGGGNQFNDFGAVGSRYGLRYAADYSSDFVDRSLVDKAYVDSAIVNSTTTLNAAYNGGGAALGRQIYTTNGANPVEILNPGTDQWETSLALTNGVNGGGLAFQTMDASGDWGGRLYMTDNTSDPENGSGAYMYTDNTMQAFEFGYQTAGTRNSSFYIDYSQMALNVPGSQSNGALRVMASNYNIPVLTLASPGNQNSMQMSVGTSTPEGRITGNSGSLFNRTDGVGSGQQIYVKTTDGGNTGWFALAGVDSNHLQKNANVLSPTDSGVYQMSVTNNSASTLTGFKAVNTNDVSNYAGAVMELKGSGADFTNNLYFGKYGSGFWIPTWAGNGVLATDKSLVLGAVGTGSMMRFQVGGGYSSPATVATLDADSLDLQNGVSLNVGGNARLGDATSDTVTYNARVASHILPSVNNTYDLGSPTLSWRDIYASGTIYGNVTGHIDPGYTEGSVMFQGASSLAQDNANFYWDDSANRLMIGTNATSSAVGRKLEINTNVSAGTSLVYMRNGSGGGGGRVLHLRTEAGNSNEALLIDNRGTGAGMTILNGGSGNVYGLLVDSGRVGFGTTTPETQMQVVGTSTMRTILPEAGLTYDFGSSAKRWNNVWAANVHIGTSTWDLSQSADRGLTFGNQSGEKVRISNVGNLGIGDSDPSHKLTVYGGTVAADDLFKLSAGSNGGYVAMYMDTVDDRNSMVEFQRDMAFYSSGFNSSMLHLSNGTVGINTDSPTQALSVVGDAIIGQYDGAMLPIGGADHSLTINAVDGQMVGTQGNAILNLQRNEADVGRLRLDTSDRIMLQHYNGLSWNNDFAIASNGFVGLDTLTPNAKLHVSGTMTAAVEAATFRVDSRYDLTTNHGASIYGADILVSNLGDASLNSTDNFTGVRSRALVQGNDQVADLVGGEFATLNSSSQDTKHSIGIRIKNLSVTGGATVDDAAGLVMEEQTAATYNANLLLGTTSVPVGNYNIYSPSTRDNYLAGDLGLGSTSPNAKLEVSGDNSATNVPLIQFEASNNSDIQSQIYFTAGGNSTYWNVNSSGAGGAFILMDESAEVARFHGNAITFNEGGSASTDFRVESDTQTHALFVDATNGYVGFDQTVPLAKLHVGNTTAAAAADYSYMRLQGTGDVDHSLYLPTGSNLMIWDYNMTGNGGAIEFRNNGSRIGLFTNSGLVVNEGGVTGVGLRVEGDTNANLLYTDAANDRVGIGTNAPAVRFQVTQSGNVVAAFDRTTNDGTIISIRQDGIEEGTISVAGNTVSYNAFTGSHYAWTDEAIEQGMLVRMTEQNRRLHGRQDSEIVYGVVAATSANDPRVLGAYLALQEPTKPADSDNPHLIAAVGNGDVWVVDQGQNVASGDYLISSDVKGHAMKDTGAYPVSYVFARAAEPVDWSQVTTTVDGIKHVKISVLFESFVRNNSIAAIQPAAMGNVLAGTEYGPTSTELAVVNTAFPGSVTVLDHVELSKDSVGQAVILVGATRVHVSFERAYDTLPIVTVTPHGARRMDYGVENVSLTGFDVVLDPIQYKDVLFDWHAFGEREAKVFVSNGTTADIELTDMGTSKLETQINATAQPEPTPTVEEPAPQPTEPSVTIEQTTSTVSEPVVETPPAETIASQPELPLESATGTAE